MKLNEKPAKNQSRIMFMCNGASNHSNYDRAEYDYYATEPKAVELFLDAFEKDNALVDSIDHNIWECACGENHITNVLRTRGFTVRTSDIIDRIGGNSGIEIIDFLESGGVFNGDIITNPPYKYAAEFVSKAMDTVTDSHKVIMFLKLTFLESVKRAELFKKYPLKYLYVSSKRLQCARNGEFDTFKSTGTALAYGWYVFEKGYKGEPIIRWFNDGTENS